MNRRNVLTGLGGLAISGGALFGSGAFTSVSAERTVEVNVVTGDEVSGIPDNDGAGAIADKFVDVRVDVGKFDSVYVNGSGDTDNAENPADLAPTSSSALVDSNNNTETDYTASASDGEVSLIANDNPTITFGSSNDGLPQNSTANYDGLFKVDNADLEGDGTTAYDIELSLDPDAGDSDSDAGNTFLDIDRTDSSNGINYVGFDSGTNNGVIKSLNSAVDTAADDEKLTLTITITQDSS